MTLTVNEELMYRIFHRFLMTVTRQRVPPLCAELRLELGTYSTSVVPDVLGNVNCSRYLNPTELIWLQSLQNHKKGRKEFTGQQFNVVIKNANIMFDFKSLKKCI
jgi:hypothetical protein